MNNGFPLAPASVSTGIGSTPPAKRRIVSKSGEDDGRGGDDKKAKPKRRKVDHACLYCRRSHMTCDSGRPCQRCIKREIGHLCHDESKLGHGAGGDQESSASPNVLLGEGPSVPAMPPGMEEGYPVASNPLPMFNMSALPPQAQGSNWPASLPQPASTAPFNFTSPTNTGHEFSLLTDFLDSLGAPPLTIPTSPPPPPLPPAPISNRPQSPLLPAATKTEQFLLTAADQAAGSRDERLARVIRSKYEAGLLKPYNYVKGYARLSRWMDRNVSQESKQQILGPLSVLRPKFRAVAQSLTDMDLVFIEEAFERLLLDYDRVFSAMGIPACLWRRTGEIYKGNREFGELVGVDGNMLREGRLCIYELMAEESAVNYWEKYGHVAFDTGQKAVLTSCVLRFKPTLSPVQGMSSTSSGQVSPVATRNKGPQVIAIGSEQGLINCCFSFTIRRDAYGIPSMIVGNFLPC